MIPASNTTDKPSTTAATATSAAMPWHTTKKRNGKGGEGKGKHGKKGKFAHKQRP